MSVQCSTAIDFTALRQGLKRVERPATWGLDTCVGRFTEVSGAEATAALTLAIGLVAEAQRRSEPTAWISGRESSFYPPDVDAAGVDLSALAVVWVPSALDAARAADLLLRSGAFGLVVMDLGHDHNLPLPAQNRLAALAKKHEAALLCLTRKEAHQPSVGSLVSLRVQAARTRSGQQGFRCEARALKDKGRGPGWGHVELYHGPDGLC